MVKYELKKEYTPHFDLKSMEMTKDKYNPVKFNLHTFPKMFLC